MKLILLLAVVVTLVVSRPDRRRMIDGEFIIRLDEEVIQSEEEEFNLITYIENHFDITFKKAFHFDDVTFLHVSGDDTTLTLAERVGGVRYVEPNSMGSVQQECLEHPSPGTWGLDRVDQREQLPYRYHSSCYT